MCIPDYKFNFKQAIVARGRVGCIKIKPDASFRDAIRIARAAYINHPGTRVEWVAGLSWSERFAKEAEEMMAT